METGKRIRAGAIIVIDGKLVTMYREFQGRIYYTFPGGKQEDGESLEDCAKRETLEEFGLVVEPIKKVYVYECERSIEHYYTCKLISGEFGSGTGEEFDENPQYGVYKPMMIDIKELPSIPLMPPEIAEAFYNDYIVNGESLRDNVGEFRCK